MEVRGREKRHGARTVVPDGGEREGLEREVHLSRRVRLVRGEGRGVSD